MKITRLNAAAATILLHAAFLAIVIAGLNDGSKPEKTSEPMKVQLLTPPPVPAPATPPAPLPPAPSPLKKERPKPSPRPTAVPKSVPQTKAATPDPSAATASEPKPTSPTTPSAPSAAAPPSSAPAPAVAVPSTTSARTSASEASYASTNRIPPYPRLSVSNGEEGTVILRVLVTAEGTAGAVEIKTSSGYPLLDESARKTIQTWRFKPATVDGKPVAEWYQVPIPFKLQNN